MIAYSPGEPAAAERTHGWRNRITAYADVDPAELLANPRNFRRHPAEQSAALSGVIDSVGYLDPVLVQAGTNVVIDGHLRLELARREGQASIPVAYVDLSDAEADLVLATFDPLTAMASHDAEALEALLATLESEDAAVATLPGNLAREAGEIPPDDFDAGEHWQGMPEYEQDDLEPAFQALVSFAKLEDVAAFEALIGQAIPRNTKAVWYPPQARSNNRGVAYVAAGSDAP